MIRKILRQNLFRVRSFSNSAETDYKSNLSMNYSKLVDNYTTRPDDLFAYKKQLVSRSNGWGMIGLDNACGKWANKHIYEMSREECERYEKEILSMESLDLSILLLESKDMAYEDFPKGHYLHAIKDFVLEKGWIYSK